MVLGNTLYNFLILRLLFPIIIDMFSELVLGVIETSICMETPYLVEISCLFYLYTCIFICLLC